MNKIFVFLILVLCYSNISGQNVQDIKNDRAKYIWGEGIGSTLKKADQEALSMLINQISVMVESEFEQIFQEDRKNEKFDLSEKVKSVVKTYSNATLNNTERIVISQEPDAKVFRYITREKVSQVFKERKNKILNFIKLANKAENETRIADALRYNYAALVLLKSHPDCNSIEYEDVVKKQHLLISFIPDRMNQIFSKISFKVKEIKNETDSKKINLYISYKGKSVVSFDYSYWDGRDWTNLFGAKNGEGFLEYYGTNAKNQQEARIKMEYMFENMARIDPELENVMKQIDPIAFPKCYQNLNFNSSAKFEGQKNPPVNTNIESVDVEEYKKVMNRLVDAIERKQYVNIKQLFTTNGYKMFDGLIAYGKASILSKQELKVFQFNNQTMCRSIRMAFNFENNYKKFVEDVVFYFNKEGKIESLSFGLNETAINSILENNEWSHIDRLVLISFLENFKTAYALKRIKYIESIFADDALIITGYLVEIKSDPDNIYKDNKIVKYNRQNKQQYIDNLKYSFGSKEYINIQFEESEVRKGGVDGKVYGVRIKQNYYSSNYGDTGYLFLIVDLKNEQEPIIHVRTWQPNKTGDTTGIYNLSDF